MSQTYSANASRTQSGANRIASKRSAARRSSSSHSSASPRALAMTTPLKLRRAELSSGSPLPKSLRPFKPSESPASVAEPQDSSKPKSHRAPQHRVLGPIGHSAPAFAIAAEFADPDFDDGFDDPDDFERTRGRSSYDFSRLAGDSPSDYFSDPDAQSYLDDLETLGAFDWPYEPLPDRHRIR